MADYTNQDINGLLPGEPWTSAKAIAAFENPVAIAEGAPGAPVTIQGWHGLNQTVHGAGDASALIWDHAVDGNLSSIEIDPIQPGYEYRIRFSNLTPTTSLTDCALEGQVNFGTGWTSGAIGSVTLRSSTTSGDPPSTTRTTFRTSGEMLLPFLGATSTEFFGTVSVIRISQANQNPPAMANAATAAVATTSTGVTRATPQTALRFRLQVSGGLQLASGKLWAYKRRIGGL